MKNTLFLLATILLLLMLVPARVYAISPESDPAGQMVKNAALGEDKRAEFLKAFLHSYDSPLEGDARTFIEEADRNNIDWRLVAAIAGTESTFGREIPRGSYNAWGWGIFTGREDGVHFNDWKDGITQVSYGLRKNYFDQGAQNLYDVGWIYAANGNSWGAHVQYFIDQINTFVPSDPQFLSVTL